ncbi:gamma-type small acid-soluble spore protein [Bacillus niameyensis]|uniref:gamma-type small acid-soluble spore protein n=1 Tax=Bacillus niameyensis TaxID=1522308 RepID=UPI0007813081|nr:gamma-type small acid-soluble spore protein [Bacillus niameyensis]
MANKRSKAGTNIEKVKQQNAQSAQGNFGTEFASETDAQQVRQQNAKSAGAQGNFGAEFGSETDAQQVRQQNQKAEANKSKNAGQ